jgi:hypothetical protein
VVATISNFDELRKRVGERHDSVGANRLKDETYLAEFEQRLYLSGQPKVPNQSLIEFRQAGYGLNVESELYEIWSQCVAMFHARPIERVPESVKLIVGGLPDESVATVMHSVAVLLEDESPFRRKKKFPVEKHLDLKAQVVRQWVAANGITAQQTLEAVDRLIAQDIDHQLTKEPAQSFLPLAPSMLKKATELAKTAGKADDRRFAFYIFRCLQRIAAYAVRGRVQWRAEWLRGAKTNARAIPGTSKMQAELGSLLREHVLQVESGHSGAKGTATTYRVRFDIPTGTMTHHDAAEELSLELDSKGVPKKQ